MLQQNLFAGFKLFYYIKQTDFVFSGLLCCNRELKIDDAATPRRGVNIYDKKKDFWNLMSVTTV